MNGVTVFRGKSEGFTLIEVVIASMILAIVITGIAFFFMHIIEMSDQMDDQARAIQICREGIEDLRSEDVQALADGWQSPSTVIEGFTRSIWIDTPYSIYPAAKHVRCRVTWSGIEGADSLSLSTIL
ncbi:MAG: type II secretion system protein [Candidatus Sabulitectum sp.]|nr:type II secretion system protein [Candidatus Sabulitectum sp.]